MKRAIAFHRDAICLSSYIDFRHVPHGREAIAKAFTFLPFLLEVGKERSIAFLFIIQRRCRVSVIAHPTPLWLAFPSPSPPPPSPFYPSRKYNLPENLGWLLKAGWGPLA